MSIEMALHFRYYVQCFAHSIGKLCGNSFYMQMRPTAGNKKIQRRLHGKCVGDDIYFVFFFLFGLEMKNFELFLTFSFALLLLIFRKYKQKNPRCMSKEKKMSQLY